MELGNGLLKILQDFFFNIMETSPTFVIQVTQSQNCKCTTVCEHTEGYYASSSRIKIRYMA